ncbi:MAG TPA: hypothetical protein VFG31_03145 [Conexibacter sp.]|nr:hypothetical protein [Conexibacter sp.]
MTDAAHSPDDGAAEELLRRALLDASDAAAVSLAVDGLPVSEAVTVVFHGRRDLGTIQTYVTRGHRNAGETIAARELLRVPCDLDLGAAEDRDAAAQLYLQQATALRDALVGADTVLDVWREPLEALAEGDVTVERSVELRTPLPAHRLLPVALVAPDRRLVIAPVCGARTLAEGKPPMGIACAQQDLARIYPLPDDPERCLAEFAQLAAEHARGLALQLERQETSVERFLELSGEDPPTPLL